jgi:hypothetical protein
VSAGIRSPLAPWVGGAASTPTLVGYGRRSLLAFWLGGAAVVPGTAEPPAPPTAVSGGPVSEQVRPRREPQEYRREYTSRPQERPRIQTEPIRPPQARPAQTFTARAPIALPLAAVAVALGLPDVPTKAAHPAPQSTREAFPLTATAIAAARIVAEMVAAEAQAAADAELQTAAERRRHNNRAAILVALLLSQQ